MNVLVTGGTGNLGRHVVAMLRQSGHRARILSRRPRGHVDAVRGDLRTGEGLARAVAGMDVIVHAASATRQPVRGRGVDVRGTRRLLALAHEANIRHVVYVSIVGIDRVPSYPYYATKLAAEAEVRKSDVPWSILRTTQFHDFVESVLSGFSRVPRLIAVPYEWQLQPIDVREVARRVVDVALGEPRGMLADFGGPEIRDMRSLAHSWLTARHDHRRMIDLRLPLRFSRDIAAGNLTCPEHKDGRTTFAQHLAEKYPPS